MKVYVKDLENIDGIKLLSNNESLDKEIDNFYTCDLLSWVMGHIHEPNTILLTVLNSMNAIAVASLLDMSAVVFCENVIPSEDIILKANEEGVPVFTSKFTTFDTAYLIKKMQG